MESLITAERSKEIDLAYCRAALYSALALAFRAPTDDTLARLLAPDSKLSLKSAAAMFSPASQEDLCSCIEALPDLTAVNPALQYRALFGHTARGQIPPYETEYGNEGLFQQPQELSDLMGFYHAFGLSVKNGEHERADHVSCELEFLMFLALKEAYALEHNDQEMLTETCKAEKLFLRDHLGRFVPTFASQLRGENGAGLYAKFADLCMQVVAADCGRLQVPLGPSSLALRPSDDNRVPMACGSGVECAAMPGNCASEESD